MSKSVCPCGHLAHACQFVCLHLQWGLHLHQNQSGFMCPAVSAVKWQKVSSSIVACACAMSALHSNACLQQDIDTSGMQFAVSGLQQSGGKVPLLGQEAFLALHSCQKYPVWRTFKCMCCVCFAGVGLEQG